MFCNFYKNILKLKQKKRSLLKSFILKTIKFTVYVQINKLIVFENLNISLFLLNVTN